MKRVGGESERVNATSKSHVFQSDEKFFIRRRGVRFRLTVLSAKHVDRNLHALQNRGSLLDGSPKGAPEFCTGFLNDFERSCQDMIRWNNLHAQPFHGIGKDAIDFLGGAA